MRVWSVSGCFQGAKNLEALSRTSSMLVSRRLTVSVSRGTLGPQVAVDQPAASVLVCILLGFSLDCGRSCQGSVGKE